MNWKQFALSLFTDHNGDSDIVSTLGIASFLAFLMFTGYAVYNSKAFDPISYATGSAALIASIGAGYRLKSGATPKQE